MNDHVTNLNQQNFGLFVSDKKQPVLIDFWAPWCGPCRQIAPEVDAAAEKLDGKVHFGKVNVDDEPALAGQYGIQSIPSLIVFKDGKPIRKMVGFQDRNTLIQELSA